MSPSVSHQSDGATLVQVERRRGRIDRVPRGRTPVVELALRPDQTIVSIELLDVWPADPEWKTVDWRWTAYIATQLEVPGA